MKILITGVAGFIGSNLAHQLVSEGHQVFGIDDFSFGSPQNIEALLENPNFEFQNADVRLEGSLGSFPPDVIVHLASHKIPRYTSALETLSSNSDMLKTVLNRSLECQARLVFASTSDIYGKNPDLPYHEESNSVLGPTTVKRWAYATSKIYSEQLIRAWSQDFGLKYTIMRFFGSYGPHQNLTWWGGPQSVFIQSILEGKTLEIHGDGLQTRTFTYVDDTVQGIVKCIVDEKAVNETFNIAGDPDSEITILELANVIAELMNEHKPSIKMVPYETFGNYEDVRRRVPCIDKIKNTLGFEPKYELKRGLTKTIEWQRAIHEAKTLDSVSNTQ